MNVIKRKTLAQFWDSHKELRAERPLLEWFRICRKARWKNLADTRGTFRHADPVRIATVFNVAGWRISAVTLIDYTRQTMLITHVLTHNEYDADLWKRQL